MTEYEISGCVIRRFIFEEMDANCYALVSGQKALVIDPHGKPELFDFLKSQSVSEVLALLTHEHPDHTYGIPRLKQEFVCKVVCQRNCAKVLADNRRNRPSLIALNIAQKNPQDPKGAVDRFLKEFKPYTVVVDQVFDERLDVDWEGHRFQMVAAPGHSAGGCLIYMDDKCVFTGDNLIFGIAPILRFPESSPELYLSKVKPILDALPGCMQVFPGHGRAFKMDETKLFSLEFNGVAVVTDDGREVSYADLLKMTQKWHEEILPRELVFLLVTNNLDSLVAYIACLNRRVVPLMLDARIDAELLARFEQLYKPGYIINCESGEVRHPNEKSMPLYPELALLLTTSGSTGSPKLVRQTYANIRANTESITEYLHLDSSERPITTLPMNYTYGLSILNSHLSVGATILLTSASIMQREFWNFFTAQNATSFGGVPYTYEMLDKLMFFRRKLPSLRTMTQAGGKILPPLHKKFAEYAAKEGKHFVVMYGQCEATARMAYLPPERALDKVGSMGIAIPGGKFKLIDVNGNEIPDFQSNNRTIEQSNNFSEVGELVYEGANVTLGYAECAADLAKGDERHGVLVTGDMAKRDADGFYYIVGRKKRFLKIFGNRVNLDETERLIKSHFITLDCACGGKDDHMKIYVTDESLIKSVQDFVADKTHLNFTAFQVVKIDKIPKNESGKTLYKELPE